MKRRHTFPFLLFLFFGIAGFSNNGISLKAQIPYDLVLECPNDVTNNIISVIESDTICAGDIVNFSGTEPVITPSNDSTFQWQSKTIAGSWEDITGASGKDYTTDTLTETTFFRRLVLFVDCDEIFPSNEIEITVNPTPPTPTISVNDSCGVSILTASNYTGTLNWSTGETTESITVNV
ncbi:MAG: hypothetical protein JXR61_02500, partial [Prolixibacteraceae bacterium]|nr:hypothetical protein [Prolixibacteraceae bacterium]